MATRLVSDGKRKVMIAVAKKICLPSSSARVIPPPSRDATPKAKPPLITKIYTDGDNSKRKEFELSVPSFIGTIFIGTISVIRGQPLHYHNFTFLMCQPGS